MTTKKEPKSAAPKTKKPQDAIALLRADHKKVDELFKEFEKARTKASKKEIVAEICEELTVHAMIEEEIFYPAFKKAMKDTELVPEALVEHNSLKALIVEVEGVEPDGEMYDAKVKVLGEYVKHHVKEEHKEIFSKAKNSKLDLNDLGEKLLKRKEELQSAM